MPRRKNGLEPPYEFQQIMSWLLLLFLVVGFYGIIIPPLQLYLQIIAGLLYGILIAFAVVMAFKTCSIDPIDDDVLSAETAPASPRPQGEARKYRCSYCKVYVKQSSKHCPTCSKCIEEYDHHCTWLNSCIGKKNYRYFLFLLANLLSFTLLELAMFVYYVVQYMVEESHKEKVINVYGKGSEMALFMISWVFVALLTPVVLLLTQLAFFHSTLIREGLTTYEYIAKEQQKERELSTTRQQAKETGDAKKSGPGFDISGICGNSESTTVA